MNSNNNNNNHNSPRFARFVGPWFLATAIAHCEAKGLVGKLPGNPASCPEEPCNSDPQHVLNALKWMCLVLGVIFLLPVLMYFLSKLYSNLVARCTSSRDVKKKPKTETKQRGKTTTTKKKIKTVAATMRPGKTGKIHQGGMGGGLDLVAGYGAYNEDVDHEQYRDNDCLPGGYGEDEGEDGDGDGDDDQDRDEDDEDEDEISREKRRIKRRSIQLQLQQQQQQQQQQLGLEQKASNNSSASTTRTTSGSVSQISGLPPDGRQLQAFNSDIDSNNKTLAGAGAHQQQQQHQTHQTSRKLRALSKPDGSLAAAMARQSIQMGPQQQHQMMLAASAAAAAAADPASMQAQASRRDKSPSLISFEASAGLYQPLPRGRLDSSGGFHGNPAAPNNGNTHEAENGSPVVAGGGGQDNSNYQPPGSRQQHRLSVYATDRQQQQQQQQHQSSNSNNNNINGLQTSSGAGEATRRRHSLRQRPGSTRHQNQGQLASLNKIHPLETELVASPFGGGGGHQHQQQQMTTTAAAAAATVTTTTTSTTSTNATTQPTQSTNNADPSDSQLGAASRDDRYYQTQQPQQLTSEPYYEEAQTGDPGQQQQQQQLAAKLSDHDIAIVSDLYNQQQQQHHNYMLAVPSLGPQHRHSIDGSILNNMVHSLQQTFSEQQQQQQQRLMNNDPNGDTNTNTSTKKKASISIQANKRHHNYQQQEQELEVGQRLPAHQPGDFLGGPLDLQAIKRATRKNRQARKQLELEFRAHQLQLAEYQHHQQQQPQFVGPPPLAASALTATSQQLPGAFAANPNAYPQQPHLQPMGPGRQQHQQQQQRHHNNHIDHHHHHHHHQQLAGSNFLVPHQRDRRPSLNAAILRRT